MKPSHNLYMKCLLRRHMERLNLAPKTALIIDGQTHEYKTKHKGKQCMASYSAAIDTFGSNSDLLICSFGIVGSPLQYSISIILQSDGDHTVKLSTNRIKHV